MCSLPLIGQVPLDPRIQEGGDTGRPIVDAEPTSRAAKELEAIAQRVVERLVSIYGS
jgi:ATP-binding protein involved in chromosome partitioning